MIFVKRLFLVSHFGEGRNFYYMNTKADGFGLKVYQAGAHPDRTSGATMKTFNKKQVIFGPPSIATRDNHIGYTCYPSDLIKVSKTFTRQIIYAILAGSVIRQGSGKLMERSHPSAEPRIRDWLGF